jgi:Ca2+-binding RTX toxin-like protein
MLKFKIFNPAGDTAAFVPPYVTGEPEVLSVGKSRLKLAAEILDGPFEGRTERILLRGRFDAATGDGKLSEWRSSVGGELHYLIELPDRLDLARIIDDFSSILRDGAKVRGNRFDNALSGDRGDDRLIGKDGADVLKGLRGEDRLLGGAGRDELQGGKGADLLVGGKGDDRLDGGRGSDTMEGGGGDDVYLVDWFGDQDVVVERAGDGHDLVLLAGFQYRMTENVEDLTVVDGLKSRGGATGNGLDNVMRLGSSGGSLDGAGGDDALHGSGLADALRGGAGHDVVDGAGGGDLISGGAGRDRLAGGPGDDMLEGGGGRDELRGGAGDDRLAGDGGSDWLAGGSGADTFVFDAARDSGPGSSRRDTIADFETGRDRIDLSAIDAREDRKTEGPFTFIADADFTGRSGQLAWRDGMVAADTDGDGRADLEIALDARLDLGAEDFLL